MELGIEDGVGVGAASTAPNRMARVMNCMLMISLEWEACG